MDNNHVVPEYVQVMAADSRDALGRPGRRDGVTESLLGILLAAVTSGLCDLAAVTERRGAELLTIAETDPLAIRLDNLQYTLGEGPCVQAAFNDGVMVSQDLAGEPRWPAWAPAASALGVHAVLSIHLYTARSAMGAVNFYSTQPRVFGSRDLDLAQFIGATASVTLANHRTTENLWAAIDARHRIGTAQGILMGRYGITVEQSFELLHRLSSRHEQKISAVAARIITVRGLPPEYVE